MDTTETEAPVTRKRRLPEGRVMPKQGALERAYRRKARPFLRRASDSLRRGVDYPTRASLMAIINQGPSVFGHLNKGRNSLHINDALVLAGALDANVEDLVEVDDRVERIVREHRMRRFAAWKKVRDEAWNARMGRSACPWPAMMARLSSASFSARSASTSCSRGRATST